MGVREGIGEGEGRRGEVGGGEGTGPIGSAPPPTKSWRRH